MQAWFSINYELCRWTVFCTILYTWNSSSEIQIQYSRNKNIKCCAFLQKKTTLKKRKKLFFFSRAEDQTQGLTLAKQVFYHWAKSPTPEKKKKKTFLRKGIKIELKLSRQCLPDISLDSVLGTHVYVYMCIHVCVYICMCVYMYVCMHLCV
jgi:hypothetical protein